MLDAATMRTLQQDAAQMATRNHQRYLAEALQALKRGPSEQDGGAIAPLMLLAKLQGSSYASRVEEKSALNVVGTWLERRLAREPNVATRRLALEIGWLRRLAAWESTLATEKKQHDKATGKQAPSGKPFGERLKHIIEMRRKALSSPNSSVNGNGPQSDLASPSSIEVWGSATVAWDPGSSRLIATFQNLKSAPITTKAAAEKVFDRQTTADRFFKKRELLGARVEVTKSGNTFRVERISVPE